MPHPQWDNVAKLGVGGISVYWMKSGVGDISSELAVNCPCCDTSSCYFNCDGSQAEDSPESEEEALERIKLNGCFDGVESMILAHAIAGVDIQSAEYIEGVRVAIDAIENQFA